MNQLIKAYSGEEYILRLLKNHNIIGLGEGEHHLINSHQFFQKILDNKQIQETINVVIVEFANAGYQDILDKYIFGEEVSINELRKIWRESTQCINQFGEAIIYFELLQKIRNINSTLASNKKIRVLGGDPPINWTVIDSPEDYMKINLKRESFAADLAIEYGVNRSKKVLMIYAEYHLTKINDKSIKDLPSITNKVNTKYPDAMHVIAVLNPRDFQLSERTINWPLYSIVDLKEDEIGNLPAVNYFTKVFDNNGRVILFNGYKIKELFDAFLYIGQFDKWEYFAFPKGLFTEGELDELNRRRKIIGFEPLEDTVASENDNSNKKIIQWGKKKILSLGYAMISDKPEVVQDTPWSYVIRFSTSVGYLYLKHTPKLLALEPTIIQILHDQFQASVPQVIAQSSELSCFLMEDAGKPLREILKQKFDPDLLCKAIDTFTSLQLSVAGHEDVFINLGVPDWRLDKLPELYKNLLLNKDNLMESGLTEVEINQLEALSPTIAILCKKLLAYSIKETLVQPDFNDNNSLINEMSQITIIDLGEIAISHPFFSLINCLYVIKKHHAITDQDDRYLKIKDACLKNFMKFYSEKNLLDAFEIAGILFFIYNALCNYRLILACGKVGFRSTFQRQGRLDIPLKELMKVCMAIAPLN